MHFSPITVAFAVACALSLAFAIASSFTSWRLIAAMRRHDHALWLREAGLQWLLVSNLFIWRRRYLASSSELVQQLGSRARILLVLALAGWCAAVVLLMASRALDSAFR